MLANAAERKAFQSTPSVGRATLSDVVPLPAALFQSTPSVGRATTQKRKIKDNVCIFQSTPSVGRATCPCAPALLSGQISIHALRGEGDAKSASTSAKCSNFNPRPPWGGRREDKPTAATVRAISIHALRGEGDILFRLPVLALCISIHALRGEGDASTPPGRRYRCISIHALRGEGDTVLRMLPTSISHFNPRPPWGGRHLL